MTEEIWRYAPGDLAGKYAISTLGKVFSVKKGAMLTGTINSEGYWQVHLTGNSGRKKVRTVHSLVCETFLGPRPQGMVCDHVNGNKLDCRLANLEYVTFSEN